MKSNPIKAAIHVDHLPANQELKFVDHWLYDWTVLYQCLHCMLMMKQLSYHWSYVPLFFFI